MLFLGIRHALDADHITAIDNLVRLYGARKRARWVGSAFSAGHMLSVCLQIIAIIFIVKSLEALDQLAFWGGLVGIVALGGIGSVNLYSMRRYGRTGSSILVEKLVGRSSYLGPVGSSLLTGMIFGLGFDTASQIAALTVSAVATATQGLQIGLILAGFFALGMISTDSLDSFILQSAFAKILGTKGFKTLSYALSGIALSIASAEAYSVWADQKLLPEWAGPGLAAGIIAAAIGYGVYDQRMNGSKTRPVELSLARGQAGH